MLTISRSNGALFGNILPFSGNFFQNCKYILLIFFKGDFHFTMHLLLGIVRLGFTSYLQPVTEVIL